VLSLKQRLKKLAAKFGGDRRKEILHSANSLVLNSTDSDAPIGIQTTGNRHLSLARSLILSQLLPSSSLSLTRPPL
jgi:hypothetical protein